MIFLLSLSYTGISESIATPSLFVLIVYVLPFPLISNVRFPTSPSSDCLFILIAPVLRVFENETEAVLPACTFTFCDFCFSYRAGTFSVTVYSPAVKFGIFIFPLLSVFTLYVLPFPVTVNSIFETIPSSEVFMISRSPFSSPFTAA